MTTPSTTDTRRTGPYTVDDLGEMSFIETNHRFGIGDSQSATRRLAKIEGGGADAQHAACFVANCLNAIKLAASALNIDPATLAKRLAKEPSPIAGLVEAASAVRYEVMTTAEINNWQALAAALKPFVKDTP